MSSPVGLYGPLKLLHHPEAIQDMKLGVHRAPTHIHLIIADLCNQACHFCAYRDESYSSNQLFGVVKNGVRNNNPPRMIPSEKVFEILDNARDMGTKAIQFTGGGEPTVHPAHAEIFQHALDNGLEISLVSNGVNWKDQTFKALTKALWVRVSLDAGTEETYCKIRSVSEAHWNKATENIKRLAELKAQGDLPLVLGVGFVVTKENYKEIVAGTQLAKDLGADNIRISAVFQSEDFDYFKDFYEEAREACQEAGKLSNNDFRVFNNFGDRIQDLKEQSPDYTHCGYQKFVTYIGGDLNVYRCCVTSYNELGLLGSIKERSFKDFWYSDELKEKFASFDAHNCSRCMFNDRNKLLNYLLDPNPTHKNFV